MTNETVNTCFASRVDQVDTIYYAAGAKWTNNEEKEGHWRVERIFNTSPNGRTAQEFVNACTQTQVFRCDKDGTNDRLYKTLPGFASDIDALYECGLILKPRNEVFAG